MKVVVCNAYFYRMDAKQWRTKQPYPPLGTLYAAAVLEQEGYDVTFIDNCLEENTNQTFRALETIRPDYFVIYEDGFNYLTKMCLTSMRDAAFKMIGHAVLSGSTVICSSSDSNGPFSKISSSRCRLCNYRRG